VTKTNEKLKCKGFCASNLPLSYCSCLDQIILAWNESKYGVTMTGSSCIHEDLTTP